jgi:predicted phosphodiesterase
MPYSEKRRQEIIELIKIYGREETAKRLGITGETIRRLCRLVNQKEVNKEFIPNGYLKKIGEIYSPSELRAIAEGGRILPGIDPVPIIDFEGRRIRIGAFTDTHIGHQKFSALRFEQMLEEFRKEKVDILTHCGDVTEGMHTSRPGQIYELDFLGYDQQKAEAIRLFSQWTETDIYAIDGNHDRWFLKGNGALIVKDIAAALTNFHFIGHDEGNISIGGKATLRLFHGEDSSSYALSYRVQKIIEAITGGEKPSVMFCGHTHKYVKIFERNIHAISLGCMEEQTSWMRGKRLAAHVGFCIVDIYIGKNGVTKFTDTFYPFYA